MANRTTVNISITQEMEREEARQQLKAKLGRGAAQAERGELLDGDEVFEELREMIDERDGQNKRPPFGEALLPPHPGSPATPNQDADEDGA